MPRHTVVLTAGVVAVGAQSFVLAPLLPDIAAGLHTGVSEVGRAFATYGVGVVVSALVLGRWLDRVPRRTALVAGMLAVVLG
ncbi:MAG: MFS transporter, partial [Pseudonocardia sp.]|nr:MFS transporter [Pseudonocardia sp.]